MSNALVRAFDRTSEVFATLGEMTVDATRSLFSPLGWIDGIRSAFRISGFRFWPQTHPQAEGTQVNYDFCRSLYRNDNPDYRLGSGFAKPIVNLQVGFIGLPTVATEEESTDEYLNECIWTHWPDNLQEMMRATLRDSKVIVRMHKPDILDPLMTIDEAEHCAIECVPPERVVIERSFRNRRIIERAIISHRMEIVISEGDVTQGVEPQVEEHDVLEIITRDSFRFYDQTDEKYLEQLTTANKWNFVPLVEVFNEYDSALQGGQSDFESVIPFMKAFHDVLYQGLNAHGYHSTPKLKFKLADITPFIANNFPDAIDPDTKQIRPGAEINWHGREIIFFQEGEDAGFIEAKSVLGDTKTLLEFLLDCIVVASETPEWGLMRVEAGSASSDRNAQTVPLIKKIDRKRINFTAPIQELCKMALVIGLDAIPVKAQLTWGTIRADDEVVQMQSFQQLVASLEIAHQSGQITDETYLAMIRRFVPAAKGTRQELTAAKRQQEARAPEIQPQLGFGQQGRNE